MITFKKRGYVKIQGVQVSEPFAAAAVRDAFNNNYCRSFVPGRLLWCHAWPVRVLARLGIISKRYLQQEVEDIEVASTLMDKRWRAVSAA